VIALAVGPFLAVPLAYKIGQTSGFLSFSNIASHVGAPNLSTFVAGAIVAVLAVVSGLVPAVGAARRTMGKHKQEEARSRYRPLWQRIYADIALLALALYGYWVLTKQGPILPSENQTAIVQDPFVGLAPGLFILAGTLLLGRTMPYVSAVLATVLRRGTVSLSMALQTISRTPRQYVRLTMLLSLTLSIGVFAAAVAGTIGANLQDQYHYQAGTTVRLVEDDNKSDMLLALPPSWHLRIRGVQRASAALRFGSYQSTLAAGDFSSPVEVLGIDPQTFAQVAWFRADFATKPLPDLVALLHSPTDPVVVTNQYFMDQSKARVGDQVQLSLAGADPVMVTIAGVVKYFPTLAPAEGVYIIANIDFVRALAGVPGPSEMWMTTDHDASTTQRVISAVQATDRTVLDYEDQAPSITIIDNPLQVGIYGVTSIGFIIAAGLSMLGLVAYLYLSMERRASDFGVLRALGSSTGQVATMLLLEQLFLMVLGVAAALIIGLIGRSYSSPTSPSPSSPHRRSWSRCPGGMSCSSCSSCSPRSPWRWR